MALFEKKKPAQPTTAANTPGPGPLVMASAWLVGAGAVFTLFLIINRGLVYTSDPANNALQSWDLLHGHLLLHGWIMSDVAFYTFELPLIAVVEAFFGLSATSLAVSMALVYLVVTAGAVALAVSGSGPAARVARAGVTLAVLIAPILVPSDRWVPLGLPDHTGTAVFLLASVLLIDRLPGRLAIPPLLCVVLAAGQLNDVTVRFAFIPAIAVVCLYRMLADRRVSTADGANLLAVALSVPLSLLLRAVLRHLGSYLVVPARTKLSPLSALPHNAALTWHALRMLFGQISATGARPVPTATAVFGACCMLAVGAGLARVLWQWRTVSRAEQILAAVIVANVGVYCVSTLAGVRTQHDLAAVLPCGAALAARALVPGRLPDWRVALAACTAALCAALVPLSAVAAGSAVNPGAFPALSAWLEGHGLRYGLGSYWQGSSIAVETGGRVQIRTVVLSGREAHPYYWEIKRQWFDPAANYANFVVVQPGTAFDFAAATRVFGPPAATDLIGGEEVLMYHRNLLRMVTPGTLPGLS